MNNVYRITNKAGVTLCFQVADDEKNAIETAKMYGNRSARYAEFVRES